VQTVLEACGDLGIRYLTLYCFSIENWKRPRTELDFLMGLLKLYLRQQAETLVKNGIRLQVLGRRDGMSPEVLEIVDHAIEISKSSERLTLSLAINYGSSMR
jgi:undecaprenyl diphosphate synthase